MRWARRWAATTLGAGATAIATTLSPWGTDASEVVAADGSGLSRYDLTSAAARDALLTCMFTSPVHRDPVGCLLSPLRASTARWNGA